jgi:antitoxin component HigA of HigAB toxin-antitoxin module
MNLSEPDTPEQGTDNAQAQADDKAPDWDYYDPDEEQDPVDAPEPEATDDGTAEAEEAPETAEEPAETEAPLDAVVTLADGTKAKVADLAQGYLRQQDYSRKTQELANERKALKANVQSLEQTFQVFVDHLTGLVPEPPPPALALTNPSQYTAQKAQYEAALAQVKKLVEIGQKPKELAGALSKEERRTLVAEENRRLAERFPETASQQGRQKFFNEVAEVATGLGFSLEELGQISDHRLFALAHYARKGMAAEQAQKVAAQKVAKAPPVAPRKPGQGVARNGNAEAMKRLNRTGSIKDAMHVDWD